MKKTYINPAMEVINIHAQNLLSGSTTSVGFGTGDKTVGDATGRYDDFDWEDEE